MLYGGPQEGGFGYVASVSNGETPFGFDDGERRAGDAEALDAAAALALPERERAAQRRDRPAARARSGSARPGRQPIGGDTRRRRPSSTARPQADATARLRRAPGWPARDVVLTPIEARAPLARLRALRARRGGRAATTTARCTTGIAELVLRRRAARGRSSRPATSACAPTRSAPSTTTAATCSTGATPRRSDTTWNRTGRTPPWWAGSLGRYAIAARRVLAARHRAGARRAGRAPRRRARRRHLRGRGRGQLLMRARSPSLVARVGSRGGAARARGGARERRGAASASASRAWRSPTRGRSSSTSRPSTRRRRAAAGAPSRSRQHRARFEPAFLVVAGRPARADAERRHHLPQRLLVLEAQRLRPRHVRRRRGAHDPLRARRAWCGSTARSTSA